jgi:hypothetical protein
MTKTIEELKKEKEDAEAAYIDSAKAADVASLAYDNAWDVRDAARTAYNAEKDRAWAEYKDAKKEIKND